MTGRGQFPFYRQVGRPVPVVRCGDLVKHIFIFDFITRTGTMLPVATSLFTDIHSERKSFARAFSIVGQFLALQVALRQTASGTIESSAIETIVANTCCHWLKQRVRRKFRNVRVVELLRFEELLRTYVFIRKRPTPFYFHQFFI